METNRKGPQAAYRALLPALKRIPDDQVRRPRMRIADVAQEAVDLWENAKRDEAKLRPVMRDWAVAESLWAAGLPVIDDLVTSPTRGPAYEKRRAELIELLDTMQPGITEIIVHCTDPSENFSHISGSGQTRKAEMNLMTDPRVKSFIEKEGIVLTTWRELKQRRDAVK